jgi:hypothetical protein
MLSGMKKTLYITLCVFLLYGCSARPIELAEIEPQDAPAATEALRSVSYAAAVTEAAPIRIEPYILPDEESRVVLPKVSGCGTEDRINEAIETKITDCVKSFGEPVWSEYSIKTNTDGILSLLVKVYSLKKGEQLAVLPLTFDSETGDICSLSVYFDGDGEQWRYALPEIVESQASRRGITLLSELLPIKDDQSYYIMDDSGVFKLVLLYRPYEITTYAAGTPQFFIPVGEIRDYLSSGSALLRLL